MDIDPLGFGVIVLAVIIGNVVYDSLWLGLRVLGRHG